MTTQEHNPNPTNINSVEAKVKTSEKQEPKGKGAAGVIFVGFLLLGFAVGFFTGNLVFGLFGGLGVGFIAMGIARAITGEW